MKSTNSRKTFTEELKGTVSEVISQLRKLVREGNARRVIIKDKNGKVLFQSQLTIGLGGLALVTALAPVVSAISLFAVMMNDIKIIVERYPDEPQATEEHEVSADVIEIREEEEEPEASSEKPEPKDKTEKTVGKDEEQ